MKNDTALVAISKMVESRVNDMNDPKYVCNIPYVSLLGHETYSDEVLWPDYAIMVMKEIDAEFLLSTGGCSLETVQTIDFYDEVVQLFQHANHIGKIAFVGFTSSDMVEYDFGPAVNLYYKQLSQMFGNLDERRNFSKYTSVVPLDDDYKWLSVSQVKISVKCNNRIVVVVKKNGDMVVYRVHNRI